MVFLKKKRDGSYFKKNICQFVPISRSFFKLQELIHTYDLHKIKLNKFVSLAEAPGGFIQCLRKLYPDTVIDLATYEKPRVYPEGIVHVIVNGTFVVNNSKHTGSRVGKIIKRSS